MAIAFRGLTPAAPAVENRAMLAFVLAAVVIPVPTSLDEACAPQNLAPFLSAPKQDQIQNELDLDQRIASTLAEERRVEAEVAAAGEQVKAAQPGRSRAAWMLALLGLCGLGLAVLAVRRGSLPMGLAAWALVAAAALMAWRSSTAEAELATRHQALTARQLALSACRGRLTETRGLLMHTRIANCTHDLSEIDEDIWGWVSRMHTPDGFVVTREILEKMHKEIGEALRY